MDVCAHACMWRACVYVFMRGRNKIITIYIHASPHRNLAEFLERHPLLPYSYGTPFSPMPMVPPSPLFLWYPLLPYANGTSFSPIPMVPPSPLCQWYPLVPYAYGTPFSLDAYGTPFSCMPMEPPSPYAYDVINGNKFRS